MIFVCVCRVRLVPYPWQRGACTWLNCAKVNSCTSDVFKHFESIHIMCLFAAHPLSAKSVL